MLSPLELEQRNELIKEGIKDCKKLIGKQKSEDMYFFYEGSIGGFEECKNLNNLEAYIDRIQELSEEEKREMVRSLRGNTEEKRLLKEELQVYDDRGMDLNKVWKLKGANAQINFVYEQLKAYIFVSNSIKKEATKHIS